MDLYGCRDSGVGPIMENQAEKCNRYWDSIVFSKGKDQGFQEYGGGSWRGSERRNFRCLTFLC